mmetsp:Transcript_35916/g.79966  ORF Transcript_35916/g.79966 Transcript_35916/m.79966 type:complete len:277 (+) Transcript_35916:406-1236(+)
MQSHTHTRAQSHMLTLLSRCCSNLGSLCLLLVLRLLRFLLEAQAGGGSRCRDDLQLPTQLVQIILKVLLIVHVHEVVAARASPQRPGQVHALQQLPVLSTQPELGAQHSQPSHGHPRLHKLKAFECQLTKHVGVAVKQHMPEVMHLPHAADHVRQLLVIHKPDRGPLPCCEVAVTHEARICCPKGVGRKVPAVRYRFIRDTRPVTQDGLTHGISTHATPYLLERPLPSGFSNSCNQVCPRRSDKSSYSRKHRDGTLLQRVKGDVGRVQYGRHHANG